VDMSTEGRRLDRIAGKLRSPTGPTLVVAMKSVDRMNELCDLVGDWSKVRIACHRDFHDREASGFNLITEPFWWNGEAVARHGKARELRPATHSAL
jgi:hypothetical protein